MLILYFIFAHRVWECSRGELQTADHCRVASVMAQLPAPLLGAIFTHLITMYLLYMLFKNSSYTAYYCTIQ